jgi:CzcA family heavy metal efflux pump
MERLIELCVRRRGAAVILSILALCLALWGAWRTPLDVFPDFVPSQTTIHTDAPGFTAEQVEQLVTHPIEKALNGSDGVATLHSESIPGLSVITINFTTGADLYHARQDLAERLTVVARSLPSGTGTPQLSPLTSSTRDLLKVGLVSDLVDDYALRDIADYVIKPRLRALPGVALVTTFGGAVREIRIEPDPQKLTAFGFTVSQLVDAAPGALALRGAGFIDLQGQRVLIQTPTPSPDVSVIGDAILAVRGGTPVRLQDVATIAQVPAERVGDALIQGRPGVLISVSSQYGASTLATTRAVEAVLLDLAPSLKAQGVAIYPALHQPANFIERAIGGLAQALAVAAALIFVALVLFLRDWRSALISFIAIPVSLVVAIAVLHQFGGSLNTMTLSGFVVALGVLVDDAVAGVENILRRLREQAQSPQPRGRLATIREAADEVHTPIFFATLVVLAVFVPELLSSSVQGRLIGPLALAFILAVTTSLIVALTTTPALAALLLSVDDTHVEAAWLTMLKRVQAAAIAFVHRHLMVCVALIVVMLAGAVSLIPFLGGTFLPEFREGHLIVQVTSNLPGTSLNEMMSLGGRISREILELPYVATIEQRVGRAEGTEDTWGPHQSEFQVELKPDADVDQERAEAKLREILSRYPGVQSEVVTFLGDRISESLTGQTAQVAIKLFGPDLATLDATAARMQALVATVPGVVDLQFKRQSGTPMLGVTLDPAALAAVGLKGQDVLDAIATDYAGTTVGQAFAGPRTEDVVVRLSDQWRQQPRQLSELTISGPFGAVPLSNVAHIVTSSGRYSVQHEDGQRFVAVTFNVVGRSLQNAVADVRRLVDQSGIVPNGVRIDYSGAASAERTTQLELAAYSLLMLVLVVIILSVGFSWRAHPWLVMINLPFSLIGGIVAVAATGIGLSLGALIGLVTVFGISARNAILLLSYYEQLVDRDGAPWTMETIIRGANERLSPIIITAVLTALGLAPLAYSIVKPGQEISGPLAVTVLGGLASSTILNIILMPALAARFSRGGV